MECLPGYPHSWPDLTALAWSLGRGARTGINRRIFLETKVGRFNQPGWRIRHICGRY